LEAWLVTANLDIGNAANSCGQTVAKLQSVLS